MNKTIPGYLGANPDGFKELKLQHLKGEGKLWFVEIPWYRLLEDVTYIDRWGNFHEIEAGYVFNGLSVPWPFWSICPPDQPSALPAALFHDFFYQYKTVPRWKADLIFFDIMKENGYYTLGCYRNWLAVRIFGWLVY